MKTPIQFKHVCAAILVGATLLGTANRGFAQPLDDTVSYTNAFPDATSVASWIYWYGNGSNNNAMAWDATKDAGRDPNSGALLFDTTFPSAAGEQLAWFGTFGNRWGYDTTFRHNATKYANISFDVLVDPSSALTSAGHFGLLQIGFYDGPNQIGSQIIPASATNGWVRIVQPIDPAAASLGSVSGIAFRIQSYNAANGPRGPLKMWVDNLQMIVSKVKLPPPTISPVFTEPTSGLNLFSSSVSSDQYQRSNIRLINTAGVGNIGGTLAGGVTYSMTIREFPNPVTYPDYQAHIFITTGPGNNSGLDYSDTNLMFLDIKQNADGTGAGTFRYKTNQPQGNAMIYGAGTLGQANSSTVLGTWSLTFRQGTNIIVQGPDGNPFSTNITQDAADLFVEPLSVAFGGQPNQSGNVGQKVILSRATVTNADTGTAIVDDNFLDDAALDTGIWSPLSAAANTVFVFPIDPGQKLVRWTMPDTGFGLQVSTGAVNSGVWTTLTGNEATGTPLTSFSGSGFRTVLVPKAALGPYQNYFRLFTRNFTKLQVLMPGETAAPGTPSGKTGTPDSQLAGQPVTVTINAVNANWYLAASADDTVNLTTTDGTAVVGADVPLVGGMASIQVTFNTAGTFTVTGRDVTDPAKTSNTGTATLVQ